MDNPGLAGVRPPCQRGLGPGKVGLMPRSRPREFWCPVVSETVAIRLKRLPGFGRPQGHFVQCNQVDCQYVDENKPPCPLNVSMFADEIRAADEARARRE